MPATGKVLELVGGGAIGDVRSILATYPLVIPHGDRALIERGEMSTWLANGCHPTAFMLAVAGNARSLVVHRGRAGASIVVIKHGNGVISNLHSALGVSPAHPFERYAVYGMHGGIESRTAGELSSGARRTSSTRRRPTLPRRAPIREPWSGSRRTAWGHSRQGPSSRKVCSVSSPTFWTVS